MGLFKDLGRQERLTEIFTIYGTLLDYGFMLSVPDTGHLFNTDVDGAVQ